MVIATIFPPATALFPVRIVLKAGCSLDLLNVLARLIFQTANTISR